MLSFSRFSLLFCFVVLISCESPMDLVQPVSGEEPDTLDRLIVNPPFELEPYYGPLSRFNGHYVGKIRKETWHGTHPPNIWYDISYTNVEYYVIAKNDSTLCFTDIDTSKCNRLRVNANGYHSHRTPDLDYFLWFENDTLFTVANYDSHHSTYGTQEKGWAAKQWPFHPPFLSNSATTLSTGKVNWAGSISA